MNLFTAHTAPVATDTTATFPANAYGEVLRALSTRSEVIGWHLTDDGDNPPLITYWLISDLTPGKGVPAAKISYVQFAANGRVRKADGASLGPVRYADAGALSRVINDIVRSATAAEIDLAAARSLENDLGLSAELGGPVVTVESIYGTTEHQFEMAAAAQDEAERTYEDNLRAALDAYAPEELEDLRAIADSTTDSEVRRDARQRLARPSYRPAGVVGSLDRLLDQAEVGRPALLTDFVRARVVMGAHGIATLERTEVASAPVPTPLDLVRMGLIREHINPWTRWTRANGTNLASRLQA